MINEKARMGYFAHFTFMTVLSMILGYTFINAMVMAGIMTLIWQLTQVVYLLEHPND